MPKTAASTASRRWLNLAEVADYLGVTQRTVRIYIAKGELPGYRVRGSRLIRVDRADVDALMDAVPTVGAAS